jgi:hypothetical protein
MGAISSLIFFTALFAISAVGRKPGTALVEDYAFGEFQHATRVVVSAQGTIFVVDAAQNKIFRYINPATPPLSVGGFGWSATSFDTPTGIATDGVNIYVSDYGNHRIQQFDRNLNFISSFSSRDTSDASLRFGYPLDIAISDIGDLFVLDGENLRVLKFNLPYNFVRSFGDLNEKNGKLHDPLRLATFDSRVFVGERDRILLFDYFGNYLGSVGRGAIDTLEGLAVTKNDLVVAADDALIWFAMDGSLQKKIPLGEVLTSEHIERLEDIAISADRLFLLSAHKVFVCKLVDDH